MAPPCVADSKKARWNASHWLRAWLAPSSCALDPGS